MRAYEYRGIAAEDARYAARHSDDPLWPPQVRAYGGPTEPTNKEKAAALGLAALRLVVPVSLVLVLLGAAYLYADDLFSWGPASIRDVAVSDLILPGSWYCIHLTNRRYGPGYALAHLLAALAIGLLVILVNPGDIDAWVVTMPAITSRAVLSFGAAFLAANFVGIGFFDAARESRWMDLAIAHLPVFAGMSVLLLAPYWLLCPAMRPLNGRNGY